MKVCVRALRPFTGDEGRVRRNQPLEVSPQRARALLDRGLVVEELGGKSAPVPFNKMAAAPEDKEGAGEGAADPSGGRRTGGPIGGGKPASSSLLGRPLRSATSKRSGGRGSRSSSSTKAGD